MCVPLLGLHHLPPPIPVRSEGYRGKWRLLTSSPRQQRNQNISKRSLILFRPEENGINMIGGDSELSSTDRIQTTESDAVQIMSQLLKTYEGDCDNVDMNTDKSST